MKKLIASVLVFCVAAVISFGAEHSHAISITTTTDASAMVSSILGPGITVTGTPTYTGGPVASGIFTNGAGEVSFASGLVLSTGDANQIPGPNDNLDLVNQPDGETLGIRESGDDDVVVDLLGSPGDADLDAIVAPQVTQDAAVLEFDFEFDGGAGGDLFFNYVFASEEYIDFVDSRFNDVFAFFLDGTNIALLPDGVTPVTINNVNPITNAAFYINNVENTNGFPVAGLNFGFDGRTTVLSVSAMGLAPGTHTIRLAVADTADGLLDSAVFIQEGTFSNRPTDNNNNRAVPEPITAALGLMGLATLTVATRRRAA